MEYKTCSRCGETKEIEKFNRDKSKSGGRENMCKRCKYIGRGYRIEYDAKEEKVYERILANSRPKPFDKLAFIKSKIKPCLSSTITSIKKNAEN